MILAAVGFLALLVLSAVLAGMETGIYSLERVRLQVRAEAGDRRAARLLAIALEPTRAICALLLAINVVHFGLAALSGRIIGAWFQPDDIHSRTLVNTLCLTPLLFVAGDLVPKNLFMRSPTRLMHAVEPLLRGTMLLFIVFVEPLTRLARRLRRAAAAEGGAASLFDRGTIHYLLTVDDEAEHLTDAQRMLAERVLKLRGVRVADRMVPLRSVHAVTLNATAAEIVALGATTRHSRLPVWAPDRTGFIGYVSVIDAATASPGTFRVESALHALPTFPADMPVTAALFRLQKQGRPIAAVTSGIGRVPVGIIAASDILEAVFGV